MNIEVKLTKLDRDMYALYLSNKGRKISLLRVKGSRKKAEKIRKTLSKTFKNVQGLADEVELTLSQAEQQNISGRKELKADGILREYHAFKRGERPEAKAENIQNDINRIRTFFSYCEIDNVNDIEPADFDRFKNHRLQKIKPSTLKRELNPVHAFFRWCYRRQLIQKDVSLMAGRLRIQQKQEIRFLTEKEIYALLSAADKKMTSVNRHGIISYKRRTPIYEMAAIALYAGLRLSEILHLKKMDIDFENNCIAVKNREGFTTKTLADRRIPMFTELREMLNSYFIGKHLNPDDYVFTTRTGRLIHRASARHSLKAVARHACIPKEKANWNILRHTFASNLVSNGVDIFKVSKWLGHESVTTTEKHYAKFRQRMDDKDIEKVRTLIVRTKVANGSQIFMEDLFQ